MVSGINKKYTYEFLKEELKNRKITKPSEVKKWNRSAYNALCSDSELKSRLFPTQKGKNGKTGN